MQGLQERIIRLLRWSEKYTKTDMVYLASGGFWSVGGQAVAALISLGLAIVIARYVPKDAYGSYKYILAVVSLLTTLSLSGIAAAVFQSIAHGYRSALVDGFRANLRWSGLVFLGAFAGGAYYLIQGNMTFGLGILLGGCITPFLSGFNLYSSIFSGEKDFKGLAWYGDFVTNIVPAIALALVAYFAPQPLYLLLAYFIGNTAAAAYAYWRGMQRYPDTEKKHDPGMLTYGKHLSAMNILTGIAGNIDQILLFHFVGPVQLAIYNFATAIPDQTKGPLKAFDSMVQARFAHRTNTEVEGGMQHKILALLATLTLGTLLYIACAPLIFEIFFSNYIDAVWYSQLYGISMLTYALGPATSFLSVKKKVAEQYVGNVIGAVFQIVAMATGILLAGLAGLIVARVITRFFGAGLMYVLYRRSVRNN